MRQVFLRSLLAGATLAAALGVRGEPVRAEAPLPSALAQDASIGAPLERAIRDLATLMQRLGGEAGVAVMDTSTGRLIAGLNQDKPLNPASDTKIVTAAAALERLGPDYRYMTGIYGVLRDGTARELVLRGHGDPSLRLEHLWELARGLVAHGLRRVEGKVLVDQGRFDDDYTPPAFEQRPHEWASFRAPVSPVALERNAVALYVMPGAEGKPATVWFEPPGFVQVSGTIETRRAGSGQSIDLKLSQQGQRLLAELGGHVAHGLGLIRSERRVDDPRLFAGYVLTHCLRSLGVEIKGEVELGGAEPKHLLVSHRSEPLGVLVRELGKNSDNFSAEMILKTLGAEANAGIGSTARGIQVLLDWLKEAGAWEPTIVLKNGSGLYDANRMSALSLARALTAAYQRPSISPDFVAQLAVGGVDGTLRSRFRKHRNTRVIRAKTGTLADVDALSGYILAPQGRPPLAFAILVHGRLGNHQESRRLMDAIVDAAIDNAAAGNARSR